MVRHALCDAICHDGHMVSVRQNKYQCKRSGKARRIEMIDEQRKRQRQRARKKKQGDRLRQDTKGERERGSEGIGSANEKERAKRIEGPTD